MICSGAKTVSVRLLWGGLLCFFAMAAAGATVVADFILVDDGDPLTDDTAWGHWINSTSHKIDSIRTIGNYQFTAYYGTDQRLRVARRDLTTNAWDIHRTAFTSLNINDAHNYASFGIDGDGYMHLSWGMHNNNLLYTRSETPVTHGEPLAFVGGSIGNSAAINRMTGSRETGVAYPNFIAIPDSGDLLFYYRTGGSGNGEYHMKRYEATTGTWQVVNQPWIARQDGVGQPTYNAYPHNLVFDESGQLHATWTFRSTTNYQTNQHFYYARSEDAGSTWLKNVNGPDIPYGDVVITRGNSLVAVDIPPGSSLINTGTMALDGNGFPVVATWWAPNALLGDHRRQYMLVWYDGAEWAVSQITQRTVDVPGIRIEGSGLAASHMSRPQLLFDQDGRAFVIYTDNEGYRGITVAYSESADYSAWQFIDLSTEDMGNRYEPTLDHTRWERDGILSIYYERVNFGSGEPVYVLEWNARAYFSIPEPASVASVLLLAATCLAHRRRR